MCPPRELGVAREWHLSRRRHVVLYFPKIPAPTGWLTETFDGVQFMNAFKAHGHLGRRPHCGHDHDSCLADPAGIVPSRHGTGRAGRVSAAVGPEDKEVSPWRRRPSALQLSNALW